MLLPWETCNEEETCGVRLETVIDYKNNYRIKELFHQIIEIGLEDTVLVGMRQSLLFNYMLCELYNTRGGMTKEKSNLVDRVIQLFHNHPEQFFSSSELAEIFSISARSLENLKI